MASKRDTGFLDKILKRTKVHQFDQYLEDEEIYPEHSLPSYFNEYIADHQLTVSSIIEKSRLSREYAYQILNGRKKNPSRDKIICLCIGAEMPFNDIQRVLKISHQGILYAKDGRDAAISVCIHNKIYDMEEINEFLISEHFDPLT